MIFESCPNSTAMLLLFRETKNILGDGAKKCKNASVDQTDTPKKCLCEGSYRPDGVLSLVLLRWLSNLSVHITASSILEWRGLEWPGWRQPLTPCVRHGRSCATPPVESHLWLTEQHPAGATQQEGTERPQGATGLHVDGSPAACHRLVQIAQLAWTLV